MDLFGGKRKQFDGDEFASRLRAIAEPIAGQIGLDYDREILDGPTGSTAGVAFQSIFMAGHLYLEMDEPDAFPTADRSVAKAGAKLVRESAGSREAETAVIFLAHALPLYLRSKSDFMWRLIEKRPGAPVNTAADFLSEAVSDFFPADELMQGALSELTEGFDAAVTGKSSDSTVVSPDWRVAREDGGDPRQDEKLVSSQFSVAIRWFVTMSRDLALDYAIEDFWLENEPRMDTFSDNLVMADGDFIEVHSGMLGRELRAVVYWDGIAEETYERLAPFAQEPI